MDVQWFSVEGRDKLPGNHFLAPFDLIYIDVFYIGIIRSYLRSHQFILFIDSVGFMRLHLGSEMWNPKDLYFIPTDSTSCLYPAVLQVHADQKAENDAAEELFQKSVLAIAMTRMKLI